MRRPVFSGSVATLQMPPELHTLHFSADLMRRGETSSLECTPCTRGLNPCFRFGFGTLGIFVEFAECRPMFERNLGANNAREELVC